MVYCEHSDVLISNAGKCPWQKSGRDVLLSILPSQLPFLQKRGSNCHRQLRLAVSRLRQSRNQKWLARSRAHYMGLRHPFGSCSKNSRKGHPPHPGCTDIRCSPLQWMKSECWWPAVDIHWGSTCHSRVHLGLLCERECRPCWTCPPQQLPAGIEALLASEIPIFSQSHQYDNLYWAESRDLAGWKNAKHQNKKWGKSKAKGTRGDCVRLLRTSPRRSQPFESCCGQHRRPECRGLPRAGFEVLHENLRVID